jgi:hypothetical protein
MVVSLAAEVIVHPLPASRNKPAQIHAKVRAGVDQELPFTVSVSNEEAALRCGADMSPVMSVASITSGSPMWDVVVQDTHILARMFAVAVGGLMNVCI